MPDFEAIELLTQAKERIFECGWGRGSATARNLDGDSASLCLEDALVGRGHFVGTKGTPLISRTVWYLSQPTGSGVLWDWNDRCDSANEVFAAIDEAILIAKETDYTPSA